jgi:hypothetical protein
MLLLLLQEASCCCCHICCLSLLLLLLLVPVSSVTHHCCSITPRLVVRYELRSEVVLLSQQQRSQELLPQDFSRDSSSEAACEPGLQQIMPRLRPLRLRP